MYRHMLSAPKDCGLCLSVDAVGDNVFGSSAAIVNRRENRLRMLPVDRYCAPLEIVNRVHRWSLPAAIDCAIYTSISIVDLRVVILGERAEKTCTDFAAPASVLHCPTASYSLAPFRSLTKIGGRQQWPSIYTITRHAVSVETIVYCGNTPQ